MHWSAKVLLPILLGAVAGILFLMPINEYVIFMLYEKGYYFNFFDYISKLFSNIIAGERPVRIVYYSSLGGIIGLITTQFYLSFQRRIAQVYMLKQEMQRSILPIISQGENDFVEFKSSFRYDYKQEKVNRALENVIMKTLAGFMNSDGGTLLIGVDDDKNIIGLKQDYETLKRKDNDGYEQAIISTIANQLGTPACKQVHLNFHTVDDKEVCKITVMASPKPVYAKIDKGSRFYIRTGSGTREMDIDEAVDYINRRYGK